MKHNANENRSFLTRQLRGAFQTGGKGDNEKEDVESESMSFFFDKKQYCTRQDTVYQFCPQPFVKPLKKKRYDTVTDEIRSENENEKR
jgi:hypothetical protein